jgi:hypothetical protein
MALSRATTDWSTDKSMPGARMVELGDEVVKAEWCDLVGLKNGPLGLVGLRGEAEGSEKFRTGLLGKSV